METESALMKPEEPILALLDEAEEKLQEAAQDSASRAFNLGFAVGLLPAALFTIVTFFLSKFSLIATGLIAAMMLLGLLAFSNLSAYISRNNTVKRIFLDEIMPEIEREVDRLELSNESLAGLADDKLPAGAILREFLITSKSDSMEEIE